MEHLKKILSLFLFITCSCENRIKNPETFDPVYIKLQSMLGEVIADELAGKSELEKIVSEGKNAAPQTGENKVYQKRLYDAEGKLNYIQQYKRALTIKIEQRKIFINREYLKSLIQKEHNYKNPDEIKSSEESLIIDKKQYQKRIVPRGTS